MKRYFFLAALVLAALHAEDGKASPLKHTFVDPNFGGSPFNGSFLESNALNQRQYDAPQSNVSTSYGLDNFSNTVTNSLLARVSSEIADAIYGENAQDSGRFTVGSTVLEFQKTNDIVTVHITDNATGEKTTVELPATAL